mgnify:CR=1 FL=1
MTTITATASGGTRNWSDTATWSPAQVPTAADDVVLAATSGNVTIDTSAAVCRSLDCQASGNYTGTLSHAAGVNLTIGDATAGAGNRIVRLSPSMTVSSNGNAWNLNSTSATQQTVTSAGKSINWLTLTGGASSSYLLADALTVTVSLVHNIGTFNTGNQAVTCGSFVSNNSNTRTLTLGSSTITCTSATTGWDTTTTTNLTVTANTATVTFTGANVGVVFGPKDYNGLSVVFTCVGDPNCYMSGATFANFTRTGTAAKTDKLSFWSTPPTITFTFTVTGNSATNRVLVYGSTLGTARTITAAAVSLTNVDFQDITGAGAASWTGTSLGDCGGNTGITFTASVTRYGVVAGNWSSTATWSATSGGAGGASVPLPQDDVILDASSAAGTYTVDMPRACRNLTCTGFTRTLSASVNPWSVYGSFTLGSGMTLSWTSMTLAGRGSHTITTAGKVLTDTFLDAPGGTYTQQDAISFGVGAWRVRYGTWVSNNYSIAVTNIRWADTSATRAVILGTSVVTSASNATPLAATTAGLTLSAASSTIVLSDTSAATKTVQGGGCVFGRLLIQGGPSNSVAITGANTWDRIDAPGGCVLTFPASTTQTFTGPGIVSTGTARNYIRFPGTGSFAHYLSVPDAAAFDVLGDAEWQLGWGPDDWTPSSPQDWVGRTATDPNRAWLIRLQTNGTIRLTWYPTGSSASSISASSTVAVPFTDGARGDAKITLDVDNGASGWTVKFYTSADGGATWSQLGADVTGAGVTSLPNVTQAVTVNTNNGASDASGNFYRFIFRSGIGGSAVLDIDPANKPFGQDSWTCATGQTVTVNGDLAKAGDGRVLLNSATLGTTATISKSGGQMVLPFTTVKDITFSGGAAFIAPPPSVLVSNTSGIRNGARYGISADGTQFFKY